MRTVNLWTIAEKYTLRENTPLFC